MVVVSLKLPGSHTCSCPDAPHQERTETRTLEHVDKWDSKDYERSNETNSSNKILFTCLPISFLKAGRNREKERSGHGPHHLHVSHHVGADEDDRYEESGHNEEGCHLDTRIWTFLKPCHAGKFLEVILFDLLPSAWGVLLIVLKQALKAQKLSQKIGA